MTISLSKTASVAASNPLHGKRKREPTEREKTLAALDRAIHSKSLEQLKTATRTTSHPAFKSCTDIHDFFEVLFPASRDRFPQGWKQSVAKLPKSIEMGGFEQTAKIMDPSDQTKPILFTAEEFESRLQSEKDKPSLEVLRESLSEKSPLFREAWKHANLRDEVTLEEFTDEICTRDGEKTDASACYFPEHHSIFINKNSDFETKMQDLIFETFNALQRSRVLDLKRRCPEREEHSFCCEWIEMKNIEWQYYLFQQQYPSREKIWLEANIAPNKGFIPHADYYRHQWDCDSSVKYFTEHPEFLENRLKELEAVAAKPSVQEPVESKKEEAQ